jgi:hypothetical protein
MTDYAPVTKALAEGADPAMLCATCPWDRNCVNPPAMTSGEVERQINEAVAKDEAAVRADPGKAPMGSLLTALVYAGKDTALQACPVLGVRLRSADGRRVADMVRSAMQSWEDS